MVLKFSNTGPRSQRQLLAILVLYRDLMSNRSTNSQYCNVYIQKEYQCASMRGF